MFLIVFTPHGMGKWGGYIPAMAQSQRAMVNGWMHVMQ